ncbi:MAG: sigma-54 dependent transcriptional regulator [Bacteroidota bacterium]|nr:sigma-54 dependent transcriptional regulator [Bacteroidota bacterium]
MGTITILIVDDEAGQRSVLSGYLRKKNFSIFEASSADDAVEIIKKQNIDIVLTDFKMPDKSGYELLKEIRALTPETTVVMMTAFGTIEDAVKAMRDGAYDYLTKPIDLEELDLLINRIVERHHLLSENRLLKEQLSERFSFSTIISQSPEMERVLNTTGRVADSKASILIRGESGTGKELIAKAIHYNSPRKEKPFIAVNCAALNENLFESELFGHEKGAFTGADKQRRGRFEMADGETLFLDEIGDVPLSIQVKLLRVLQEQQFERVGGIETMQVDVRLLAATNKNLEQMIKDGTFREDLFYRLNVVTIDIPPLRERRTDIPILIEYNLKRFGENQNKKNLSFSKEAWDILVRYDFPGNIRELENIVQRAVILSRQDLITTDELPQVVKEFKKESELQKPETLSSLPAQVEKLEKEQIFEALRITNGNQSKAAEMLNISERNLRYRLKKWGVK